MKVILDASALLAFLHNEPGAALVDGVIADSVISAVNWSEVMQKCLFRRVDVDGLRGDLESLGLTIVNFSVEEAECAAELWSVTRSLGLSLGDRACLAVALLGRYRVLTADKAWLNVPENLNLDIQVIR
ncbi:MAG: type II toxin-antitoxin system VapC family toxin [Methylomonas sp.]